MERRVALYALGSQGLINDQNAEACERERIALVEAAGRTTRTPHERAIWDLYRETTLEWVGLYGPVGKFVPITHKGVTTMAPVDHRELTPDELNEFRSKYENMSVRQLRQEAKRARASFVQNVISQKK